jgi:hypothetical protein
MQYLRLISRSMKNRPFPLMALLLLLTLQGYSQSLAGYTFSASVGSFTPLTAPTNVWVAGNDVTVNSIPIGFSFGYGGPVPVQYSQIAINSNGWIQLGNNFLPNLVAYANNNLAITSIGPIIAPLWDDLAIDGSVNYQASGSPGNRIFTVEWLNMNWYWGNPTAAISFQLKLYEASGDIEFIYRQESATPTLASASIGLNNASASDFWSLPNTGSSPVPAYGVETNTLNTRPATDQVYQWQRNSATAVRDPAAQEPSCSIFPNPFRQEFLLQMPGLNLSGPLTIRILNTLGETVYAETRFPAAGNSLRLAPSLTPGLYYLQVTDASGMSASKSLVKE